MKKIILFSVLFAIIVASCQDKKPAVYTRLGNYTPYDGIMEQLNGRVASVSETNFWTMPEGETYVKGAKMTRKDLDSLNYTGDFEVKFDEAGDLLSCKVVDENKKVIWKWELIKEKNILTKATYTYLDTLRGSQKLECNASGEIIKISQFPADADTLFNWASVTYTPDGDTVIYQWHNYKGEPTLRILNLFNESNLFNGYQSFGNDGVLRNGSDLKYNEKGVVSEMTLYDKEKKPVSKNTFTYEYDKMGNWVRVICKDDKGFTVIGERVYTYFD